MNRTLVGVLAIGLATTALAFNVNSLAQRTRAKGPVRQAQDQSVVTRVNRVIAARATPTPTPTSAAASPHRPLRATAVREASAAGPWTPSSPLPSSRDVDSILPPDDTYTTHGTGTIPPPPLGRTWDPSRETYNEWYARVIAGTAADPSTYPNSGSNSGGPNSGNSSTTPTGGTNQWGEWAYTNDVSVVGRVFLPDGTTPGVGFAVYIVPMFLNPPFPMPAIHTYTDADGYFYADLWASGVWSVAVVKNTPVTENRLAYFAVTYDRMNAADANTLILQTRLAGSWR